MATRATKTPTEKTTSTSATPLAMRRTTRPRPARRVLTRENANTHANTQKPKKSKQAKYSASSPQAARQPWALQARRPMRLSFSPGGKPAAPQQHKRRKRGILVARNVNHGHGRSPGSPGCIALGPYEPTPLCGIGVLGPAGGVGSKGPRNNPPSANPNQLLCRACNNQKRGITRPPYLLPGIFIFFFFKIVFKSKQRGLVLGQYCPPFVGGSRVTLRFSRVTLRFSRFTLRTLRFTLHGTLHGTLQTIPQNTHTHIRAGVGPKPGEGQGTKTRLNGNPKRR